MLKELCETSIYEGAPNSYKPNPYLYGKVNSGATPERLQKLANIDPLAAADWDGKLADPKTDYLANGGIALEEAINKDPMTKSRLRDALELFIGAEMESRTKIENAIADAGICTTKNLNYNL